MAKMKVHELAKELNRQSKDILSFLQGKGIEAKAAQSSLDDSAVSLVRNALGGGMQVSGTRQEATAGQKAKESTSRGEAGGESGSSPATTGKEPGSRPVSNTAEKGDGSASPQAADAANATEATTEQPKKKKKIIIVSNQQNSKIAGQKSQNQQGQNAGRQNNRNAQGGQQNQSGQQSQGSRGQRGQQTGRQGQNSRGGNRIQVSVPVRPIRPLTPPSPTPSVQMVPSRPQPSKKPVQPTEKPVEQAVEKKVDESTVQAVEKAADVSVNIPASGTPASEERTVQNIRPETTQSGSTDRYPQNRSQEGNGGYAQNRSQGGNGGYTQNRSQGGNGGYSQNRSQGGNGGYSQNRSQDGNSGYSQNRSQGGNGGYSQNRGQGGNSGYSQNRGQGGNGGYSQNRGQEGSGGYSQNRGQSGNGGYSQNRGQGGNSGYAQNRGQGGNGGYTQNRSQDGNSGYAQNRGQGGSTYAQGRSQGGQNQNRGGAGNGRFTGRPDGAQRPFRPGSEGGQGGNRSANGGQGGSRGFGAGNRDNRGNGGPGDKFRNQTGAKSFTPDAAGKDVEKKREEEKRRFSQEKDKRSRKDLIYEDDDKVKAKPGRFIRPEKKAEDAAEEAIKVIVLPEKITIKELAERMKLQPSVIVKKLFLEGRIVTVNQEISYEDAETIAMEYDILCEKEVKVDVIEELLKEEEDMEEELTERPPVICVMGHVDHGKTSLLDAIRKTNVTDKEAGGITQHIGAYTVNLGGRKITFLDTPGHEAFTAMRMRGANATDIAILVVAADDGVMPQTVEAINHAKAAGIEILVAVNKIDKPSANIDRVKQELAEYELIPEDWGGSTVFAPVSAKSGEGIEQLLEMILLTADILELKANPDRRARGLVIEAELDKGRGPVATVLVQKGTLHVGDFISAGASHGKVRAMIDDKGRRVKDAGPSTPVEILGLSDVPSAGEVFIAHENDKTAKNYAETYLSQNKEKMLEDTKARMSLDDLFSQIQEGNLKELNLIVKADVQGSVEAVKQSLLKLSNEEVVVKCIHGGVGAINESDVMLASASSAIIIGFNVRPDATSKNFAEREGVDVRLYKVIYQAIEDIEAAMKGMLDPVFEEKVIGHAEVRQIFKASAIGNIAGSYVLDGVFQRGSKVRITREGNQIFEGGLASLKRFKDDVKEVKAGFECGLVFEGFDQMQELDIVEAYIMVEVPR